MTGYLTIVGVFLFLMVGLQTHLGGILNTIRLRVPSGMYVDDHMLNETGDKIIHAYVRIISEKTPT